jgi:hypothetical protein
MSMHVGYFEDHASARHAELLLEAKRERLAALASRPSRPLRSKVAFRLHALADWLDASPGWVVESANGEVA